MRTSFRLTLAAFALVLSVGAAACSGGSPTASTTVPAGPHLNSGIGFGPGNVVPKNHNNAAADSGSTAAPRGGITFGSGN